MSIVGPQPETGLRIEIERSRAAGPPWTYEGEAVTPDTRFPLRATVARDGDVKVELSGSKAPGPLAESLRRIVRAAYRHARDENPEAPPPRRIVRWRAGT